VRMMSAAVNEAAASTPAAPAAVKPEAEVPGMTAFLDSLKYDKDGLVAVIVQVHMEKHATSRS
jgi:hypothetical protein